MGVVFLLVRLLIGGYFAWSGVQRLDAYNRALLIAGGRQRSAVIPLVTVPLAGLMLTVGGMAIVIGVFPAAGIALLVAALVPSAFSSHAYWSVRDTEARAEARRGFWRTVTLALLALALLAVPQPWPLTMIR
jgi:putative oxidoreductase